jgi:hypothetical protein
LFSQVYANPFYTAVIVNVILVWWLVLKLWGKYYVMYYNDLKIDENINNRGPRQDKEALSKF